MIPLLGTLTSFYPQAIPQGKILTMKAMSFFGKHMFNFKRTVDKEMLLWELLLSINNFKKENISCWRSEMSLFKNLFISECLLDSLLITLMECVPQFEGNRFIKCQILKLLIEPFFFIVCIHRQAWGFRRNQFAFIHNWNKVNLNLW